MLTYLVRKEKQKKKMNENNLLRVVYLYATSLKAIFVHYNLPLRYNEALRM